MSSDAWGQPIGELGSHETLGDINRDECKDPTTSVTLVPYSVRHI
jgi:hypothetical protein